jgi:hypothetical protein
MRLSAAIIPAILLAAALGCGEAQTFKINGIVTLTGEPLADVVVNGGGCVDSWDVSDGSGAFTFKIVRQDSGVGQYSISYSGEGIAAGFTKFNFADCDKNRVCAVKVPVSAFDNHAQPPSIKTACYTDNSNIYILFSEDINLTMLNGTVTYSCPSGYDQPSPNYVVVTSAACYGNHTVCAEVRALMTPPVCKCTGSGQTGTPNIPGASPSNASSSCSQVYADPIVLKVNHVCDMKNNCTTTEFQMQIQKTAF